MERTTYEENEQIKKRTGRKLFDRIEKKLRKQMKSHKFETWEERYYYFGWQFLLDLRDFD